MKAIKCSRCGKYQDTSANGYSKVEPRSCVKVILQGENGRTKTTWYDLCEKCTKELEAWVNGNANALENEEASANQTSGSAS